MDAEYLHRESWERNASDGYDGNGLRDDEWWNEKAEGRMRKVAVSLSTFEVFVAVFVHLHLSIVYSAAKHESNDLVEIETASEPCSSIQTTF